MVRMDSVVSLTETVVRETITMATGALSSMATDIMDQEMTAGTSDAMTDRQKMTVATRDLPETTAVNLVGMRGLREKNVIIAMKSLRGTTTTEKLIVHQEANVVALPARIHRNVTIEELITVAMTVIKTTQIVLTTRISARIVTTIMETAAAVEAIRVIVNGAETTEADHAPTETPLMTELTDPIATIRDQDWIVAMITTRSPNPTNAVTVFLVKTVTPVL
jgi:hypothetical protein